MLFFNLNMLFQTRFPMNNFPTSYVDTLSVHIVNFMLWTLEIWNENLTYSLPTVYVCDITSFDMYDYNSGEEEEYGE